MESSLQITIKPIKAGVEIVTDTQHVSHVTLKKSSEWAVDFGEGGTGSFFFGEMWSLYQFIDIKHKIFP